jgi:hypothetical protein
VSGIDAFTSFCSHFDGNDGATAAVDSAQHGHTITFTGSAQLDTAQFKFGSASLLSDATSKISIAQHASLAFGTGDCVIDFWHRRTAHTGVQVLCDWRPDFPAAEGVTGLIYSIGDDLLYYSQGSNRITAADILSLDEQQHIALVRSSGTTKLFRNGVQVGSSYTDSADYECGANGMYFASGLLGWMDEIRVSKGTNRGWASGFTPPAEAYSADAVLGDDGLWAYLKRRRMLGALHR